MHQNPQNYHLWDIILSFDWIVERDIDEDSSTDDRSTDAQPRKKYYPEASNFKVDQMIESLVPIVLDSLTAVNVGLCSLSFNLDTSDKVNIELTIFFWFDHFSTFIRDLRESIEIYGVIWKLVVPVRKK